MTGAEFDAIVAPARALVASKGEDYNHAVTLHEYFPFQDKSYVQMCYMKAMRMRSLVQQDREPNFDSIKDTALDLLNYTVFFLDYLEKKHAPTSPKQAGLSDVYKPGGHYANKV